MKDNRTVLITGAAGGVGTLLVQRFLANDDKVIATDTRKDVLDTWRERFPKDSKLATAPADISVEADCEALADLARSEGGRVDVLINCAGYFPIVPFEKMTSDDWRKVIDTNLTGTFLMCAAIVPLMKDSGWGRIINFGSGSVFQGTPGQAHYVAAKAGVVGFTRSLAREIGGYGITVNVITPGLTVTKAVKDSFRPNCSPRSVAAGRFSATRFRRTWSGRSSFSPRPTLISCPDRRLTSTAATTWFDRPFVPVRLQSLEERHA